MTILLLIRHGTNDYVQAGRLAGWTPGVHINAQGQREVDAAARRLAHIPIQAIYSSPLERAVETAQAVAACHKLDVQIREELGEFRSGEWSGRFTQELAETETWKQLHAHPAGVRLPGGETIDEVQARMVATIDAIVAAHPKQVVAVVSHADPLKAAIAHYLEMDLNNFQRMVIDTASVTVFMFGEGKPVLLRLNDNGQLPSFKPEQEAQKDNPAEKGKGEKRMAEPNIVYDLNPVSHITVAALGQPGKRTFYIQAQQGSTVVTLVSEKDQIAALARGIDEMLERLGTSSQTVQVSEREMELAEPIDPIFRIGQLGLGFDQDSKLLVLVAYELSAEENEVVNVVRFWATADQMRKLARHAAAIVAAGRPICVMCGRPIDPEGHFCPKRNGHGEKATLT